MLTLTTTTPPRGESALGAAVFRIHGKLLDSPQLRGSQLNFCSTLKRMKAYANLEDVRPTIRNKPSGLRSDWHRTASKLPASHQQAFPKHARSSSLASTSSSIPLSPVSEPNHSLSLVAVSPPSNVSTSFSPPFYGDLVPIIDRKAANPLGPGQVNTVCIFINLVYSRAYPPNPTLPAF